MDRLKAIVREPALLVDLAETLLVVAVAYGWALSRDQQGYIVAAIIAVAALIKGFTTHPFPVTVFPDATRAILVVAATVFGAAISADQIAVTATLIGTIVTVISRGQITPVNSSVDAPAGAGAGPVTGEAGYTTLAMVGVVLAVLGVLGLILIAVHNPLLPLIWCILLVVIGAALVFFDRRAV